jgi:hypothetical protein
VSNSTAPLARRRFPVRQPRAGQLSLPGLLHAAETHPELPAMLRPVVLALRRAVVDHRVIDVEVSR